MSVTNAIGLIEVIGLPTAIEAADAAMKAANVKLISVAKADAGILTIELTGDVGAVNAAVKAGAAAAERVGQVRASHVIPRVDESLLGRVIRKEDSFTYKKKKEMKEVSPTSEPAKREEALKATPQVIMKEAPQQDPQNEMLQKTQEETLQETPQEIETVTPQDTKQEIPQDTYPLKINREEELKKMSNSALRNLINAKGKEYSDNEIKNMRKQDLIQIILDLENQSEGDR